MQKNITLRLTPGEAADDVSVKQYIASFAGKKETDISGFHRIRQSIDARGKQIWINLSVTAFINEPFLQRDYVPVSFPDVSKAKTRVAIIGAGPAGLFAALKLIEAGIQPIILERGKDVKSRRRDLAQLNREGLVNPESNYCFGEGGAGTYSDGKLYTRSSKRGDINRILNIFYQFGADERVLYEAHPHIGTNKLPHIITAIRQQILDSGGLFHFEKKVVDFVIEKDKCKAVVTADGDAIAIDSAILATGHSARDIFTLLERKGLQVEAKPFALGVRIEHPQALIDTIQYHCVTRDGHLPPASYGLVEQVNDRGVFSFCMCPGGIIAPAATGPGELVVNGWSPSKRNNPYANSGMVVQVEKKDAMDYFQKNKGIYGDLANDGRDIENSPLLLMHFQRAVEQSCFKAGGGKLVAPAQRMTDFCSGRLSTDLPGCSYLPGVKPVEMSMLLPGFVAKSLQQGFLAFGKKMRGYYTENAVVLATESRTSSPVRIPRDPESLAHLQIGNLYPCGEGAGYAGGIVSAAMDGERVADSIIKKER